MKFTEIELVFMLQEDYFPAIFLNAFLNILLSILIFLKHILLNVPLSILLNIHPDTSLTFQNLASK